MQKTAMEYEQVAVVDLGSNSFRLEVGRIVVDQIYSLDSLKETVRLAFGLTRQKLLSDKAQQRGPETLNRFAERLRGFVPDAVRAVVANTLRAAKNAGQFIRQAEAVLGVPIELIGRYEKARLIWHMAYAEGALADESAAWQRVGWELRVQRRSAAGD